MLLETHVTTTDQARTNSSPADERRNYSMWVKATSDNIYFRETGILNLTNHEIGTHFFRSINDGLQPWFANRLKFGLGSYKCQSMKDTEEGLASLNTAFESKVKYIWGPAMLYYIACMSMEMNFKELFDHLKHYVADPEIRWKWVVRVKRGRPPSQLGGCGKDQCYFRDDKDDKSFGAFGESLKIEHEPDDDESVAQRDDADDQPPEEQDTTNSSAATSEKDSESTLSLSPEKPRSFLLTGRRRSDSFCTTQTHAEQESASFKEEPGKSGCADVFCVTSRRRTRAPTPHQQKEQQRLEIQEYFGNCASADVSRPSSSLSYTSRQSTPPNSALQLVREIPSTSKLKPAHATTVLSTPKPQLFEISSKSAKRDAFPRLPNGQAAFPQPASRSPTPNYGDCNSSVASASTHSIGSAVSRKSLKKNITVFFSDLIPFSKSRRKRILPLPVK